MSFWDYPRYVPKAEKQARAAKKLEQLKKKRDVVLLLFRAALSRARGGVNHGTRIWSAMRITATASEGDAVMSATAPFWTFR